MTFIYSAGRQLGRFCFGTFGRLEVAGRESVPPYAPLIIIANHVSFNDPPVLVAAMDRKLSFIGKRGLFRNPLSGFMMRQFQVHPLDRSGSTENAAPYRYAGRGAAQRIRPQVDAVKLSLELLAQDKALVIFPEGRRSPNHALIQGHPGAAYLALKSQATILPVGITGGEKFPSWRMPFPLCHIRVNIGQPFSLPVVDGSPDRQVLKSLTDMMMQRIAALLPEEYRGVYAAQPPAPVTLASSHSRESGNPART